MKLLLLLMLLIVASADDAPLASAGPDERLTEVVARLEQGDAEGARLLAADVVNRFPTHAVEALYLQGLAWQLAGDLHAAADAFRAVVHTRRGDDARFRLAMVLGEAGDAREAFRALRGLTRRSLGQDDRARLDLLDLSLRVDLGRAVARAERVARRLDDDQLTWFQGRVHLSLLRHHAKRSVAVAIAVPDRRMRRALTARAATLARAEAQAEALVPLAQAEHLVRGLLTLGKAWEALGDALVATPVPPSLPPDEQARYVTLVREHAADPWLRARQRYDLGLEVVGRLGWQGPEVEALAVGRTRLDERLEADAR